MNRRWGVFPPRNGQPIDRLPDLCEGAKNTHSTKAKTYLTAIDAVVAAPLPCDTCNDACCGARFGSTLVAQADWY